MNYQHLEYFLKAAEYQHLTRAAEELHITQPALTKAIVGIEEELGAPVFEKRGRNIQLTKYGSLFLPYAKRSIQEVNDGIIAVRQQIRSDNNILNISSLSNIVSTALLPLKSAQFNAVCPDCTLNISFKYTTSIINDVLNGSSVFGICGDFFDDPNYERLDRAFLYSEEVIFVISKDHPLAGRKTVEPGELRDVHFAVFNVSMNGTNRLIYRVCREGGFEPKKLIAAYNDYGVLNQIISNKCVTLFPLTYFEQLKNMPIEQLHVETDLPLRQNVNLIWRRDAELSEPAKRFREIMVSGDFPPQTGGNSAPVPPPEFRTLR